jgi:DNA-binding MarR family transcriptional regulator
LKELERELMEYLETIVSRYACTKENSSVDVCRKGELKMIEILGKEGSLMMSEIASRAGLSTSTVTTVMDGLVDKGLVQRERSENDRRVVSVELTKDGKNVYREIEQFHLGLVRGMLSNLSSAEQGTLISLFRKIVNNGTREKKTAAL